MPKSPHTVRCSEQDSKTLEEWARSQTQEARLVERVKIWSPIFQPEKKFM